MHASSPKLALQDLLGKPGKYGMQTFQLCMCKEAKDSGASGTILILSLCPKTLSLAEP